jgi:NTP pyrophosphatase (non-canonical NTP hydrolase)
MEFQEITERALEIRRKYAIMEEKRYGSSWTGEELGLGFVGDVGDLAKLIVAMEGKRNIPDAREKLAHELADCLWSVIILADRYQVNLEQAFLSTMNSLDAHISQTLQNE